MMTHPHHLPAPQPSDDDDTFASIPSAGGLAGNPLQTYPDGTYIDEPLAISNAHGTLYYHQNGQYSVTALTIQPALSLNATPTPPTASPPSSPPMASPSAPPAP